MSDVPADQFGDLYRAHYREVFRLALGLAGNAADAEEIAQEAFVKAFRAFADFRGEASFRTWIYRIALNVTRDRLKERARFPAQALEEMGYVLEEIIDPDPASDPETGLLARQARVKCLHSLTECLRAQERRVFCLAVTLGLPHRRVAEILECSVAAVKTTLHRARKRWFGYMEDRCELLNPANPCSCRQWVRFGLAQGWISKQDVPAGAAPVAARTRAEVGKLKALREIYQELHREMADEAFAERVREGIRKGEWAIFS